MTKDQLTEDAKKLKQPSAEAYREYAGKRHELAEMLVCDLLNTRGFDDVVSAEKTEMLRDNIHNQFKFMESVFLRYQPSVFVHTIAWAFGVYLSHGFTARFWDFLFPAVLKLYRDQLTPGTCNELAPFYEWMQARKDDFVALAEN